MRAQIPDSLKTSARALLLGASFLIVACATEKKPALVDDPDAKHESTIPWNKQEQWEVGGQIANMTDHR